MKNEKICFEKFKTKHCDKFQKTQRLEDEKNAIQSSFTQTSITYKKCNELISHETPSKRKYLQKIPENTYFKVQDPENQTEYDTSVETSFKQITKSIPEAIYAFRPKKPNLELSHCSKMLIALFDESEFIKTYD